jgi:hypothetical protein
VEYTMENGRKISINVKWKTGYLYQKYEMGSYIQKLTQNGFKTYKWERNDKTYEKTGTSFLTLCGQWLFGYDFQSTGQWKQIDKWNFIILKSSYTAKKTTGKRDSCRIGESVTTHASLWA